MEFLSVRKSGNPEHFNCNLSFVWRVLIIIKIYLQFFSVSRLIAAADLDLFTPDLHGPGPCQAVLRFIQTYEKEPGENSCNPDSSRETDSVTVTDNVIKVKADLTFSSE